MAIPTNEIEVPSSTTVTVVDGTLHSSEHLLLKKRTRRGRRSRPKNNNNNNNNTSLAPLASAVVSDHFSTASSSDESSVTASSTTSVSSSSSHSPNHYKRNSAHHHNDNNSSSSTSGNNNTRRSNNRRRCRKRATQNNTKNVPELTLSAEEQAQYIAMDCEMVGVGEYGLQSALARVTLIDWNGNVLLDQFIRPTETVTDYRTFVSGITQQDLSAEHTISMEECRQQVLALLQDKILIGHGLKNDLTALGITHPWQQTRDTAKYEPYMKVRYESDGILWPRKLKDLASDFLHVEIQCAGQPHSPLQDASAALDLYKLARNKWEKVMQYKIAKTMQIMEQQQQQLLLLKQQQ